MDVQVLSPGTGDILARLQRYELDAGIVCVESGIAVRALRPMLLEWQAQMPRHGSDNEFNDLVVQPSRADSTP